MGRIEELCEHYHRHISIPWQKTIAGAQRVIMVVYDKELERTVRARKTMFAAATEEAGHVWREIDLADAFARWMAADDYREEYFKNPDDIQIKLDEEFSAFAAEEIRKSLREDDPVSADVLAVFGIGALFGFTRISRVIKMVEADIKGRMVLFFPGQLEKNNYRLLDARDGWNYLAVPITLHTEGGQS